MEMNGGKTCYFSGKSVTAKKHVRTARDKLRKQGPVTSGGMTAELTFGFWTDVAPSA